VAGGMAGSVRFDNVSRRMWCINTPSFSAGGWLGCTHRLALLCTHPTHQSDWPRCINLSHVFVDPQRMGCGGSKEGVATGSADTAPTPAKLRPPQEDQDFPSPLPRGSEGEFGLVVFRSLALSHTHSRSLLTLPASLAAGLIQPHNHLPLALPLPYSNFYRTPTLTHPLLHTTQQ
jgi:hypothetical protein